MRDAFIPIEHGARFIDLRAAFEVEIQSPTPDDPAPSLLLLFPAPGFEPDAPHLVVLRGADMELALRYFQARAAASLQGLTAFLQGEHTTDARREQVARE